MCFTYEREKTNQKLETYEWDNIWLERAPINTLPRVMIIGDSISCGYRRIVTEVAGGAIYADGIGTSKALDNPWYSQLINYVFSQEPDSPVMIQFNNGLHGWHLTLAEYKRHYIEMAEILLQKEKPLILALTTPLRSTEDLSRFDPRNEEVLVRNQAVCEMAAEKNLIVNNLYALTVDKPELWSADGVHFTEAGYRVIASQTVELMKQLL